MVGRVFTYGREDNVGWDCCTCTLICSMLLFTISSSIWINEKF